MCLCVCVCVCEREREREREREISSLVVVVGGLFATVEERHIEQSRHSVQ